MSGVLFPEGGKQEQGEGTKSDMQRSVTPPFFCVTAATAALPTQANWDFDLPDFSYSMSSTREDSENKRMEVLSGDSQNKLQGRDENKM